MSPTQMLEVFKSLLEQSTVRGSRSSALKSVQWILGISVSGLIGALQVGAPTWLLISFCVPIGLTLALFLFTFLYLLFKNPDALRSEHYELSKIALEKGYIGDDITGLIKAEAAENEPKFLSTAEGDQKDQT